MVKKKNTHTHRCVWLDISGEREREKGEDGWSPLHPEVSCKSGFTFEGCGKKEEFWGGGGGGCAF